MKTFIAYLSFVSGCFVTNLVSAQATLEPCEMEFLGEYYSGVDKIIDYSIEQTPQLSLTVLPSFFPESGIRVVGNKIYSVELKSSFWEQDQSIDRSEKGHMGSSAPKVKTQIFSASLNPELAARIKQTYIKAISNAKPSDRHGLDGVSYRFLVSSVGCGTTWSPKPETPDARLVELLELLAAHSKLSQPRDIQSSEESITKLLNSIDGGA